MRDLNLVAGCKYSLDSIGCDYEFMSIVPFHSKHSDDNKMTDVDYLLEFYKEIIDIVHPSVLEIIFNGNWNNVKPRPEYVVPWDSRKCVDNHSTPKEHLTYLEKIFPTINFSQESLNFVEDSNKLVLSNQFTMDTYVTNLTPRLGCNYTDPNFTWDYNKRKIEINNE